MWGSLSLGTLRDAAAKIKDGLEAQMDEAMTNAGPRISRLGLNAEQGNLGEGAMGEDSYGSSAGRAGTSSLSPVAKIPGLPLIGGWGGSADESGFGDDGGSEAHPKASDPGTEGGPRILANERTSRGYTRASSGMPASGRSSWSPGEYASPSTRPPSNEGFSDDMAGVYAFGGKGTGGGSGGPFGGVGGVGQAESARERRERMRRERLERFDKKESSKDRDTGKDAPKLMVQRLPVTPLASDLQGGPVGTDPDGETGTAASNGIEGGGGGGGGGWQMREPGSSAAAAESTIEGPGAREVSMASAASEDAATGDAGKPGGGVSGGGGWGDISMEDIDDLDVQDEETEGDPSRPPPLIQRPSSAALSPTPGAPRAAVATAEAQDISPTGPASGCYEIAGLLEPEDVVADGGETVPVEAGDEARGAQGVPVEGSGPRERSTVGCVVGEPGGVCADGDGEVPEDNVEEGGHVSEDLQLQRGGRGVGAAGGGAGYDVDTTAEVSLEVKSVLNLTNEADGVAREGPDEVNRVEEEEAVEAQAMGAVSGAVIEREAGGEEVGEMSSPDGIEEDGSVERVTAAETTALETTAVEAPPTLAAESTDSENNLAEGGMADEGEPVVSGFDRPALATGTGDVGTGTDPNPEAHGEAAALRAEAMDFEAEAAAVAAADGNAMPPRAAANGESPEESMSTNTAYLAPEGDANDVPGSDKGETDRADQVDGSGHRSSSGRIDAGKSEPRSMRTPSPAALAAAAAAEKRRRTAEGSNGSVDDRGMTPGVPSQAPVSSAPGSRRDAGAAPGDGSNPSSAKVEELHAALAASREREDALTAQLLNAQELLTERERQLETTNLSMAEMMQNAGEVGGVGPGGGLGARGVDGSEDHDSVIEAAVAEEKARGEQALTGAVSQHRREVMRLEGLLEAERAKSKAAGDAVKSWENHAEEWQEKDRMLQAYMDEGAMLAFKQSEMEKTVRKARGALRGVQEERDALAKEKTCLQATIAGLKDQLREKEEERASQTQSLAAMGAVSQASSQRLTAAEKELEKTRESLVAKKTALDKAWAEVKELKRNLAEVKANKESLERSVEDGGKAQAATQSELKEWQARETTLLLEQGQLQETLERVRREADRREDEAKDRLEDVRRRWKDAVARAEVLQAEAHESTAPLLRQVRSLQEEMRLRQEAVRAAEASLADRAALAESACREAEARRRHADATAVTAQESAHRAEGEVETLKFKVARLEAAMEESKAQEGHALQRVSELEGELAATKETARAASLGHKATESKLRLQVADAEDRLQEISRRAEVDRREARETAQSLREQLEDVRRGGGGRGLFGPGDGIGRAGRRGRDSDSFSADEAFGDPLRSGGGIGASPRGRASTGASAGGGAASFAEVERWQSLARQREGQAEVLRLRLEEIQATRDALTDEVTALGRRNTELEAAAKAVSMLRDQVVELSQKNTVLLDLLGEKTEDFEALQSDMQEVQSMYRAQYDELLSKQGLTAGSGK